MFARSLALALFLALPLTGTLAAEAREAVLLEIKGPIGPATSDYIHRGFEKARAQNAAVVILRMDTPGGLDTSMREIIQDILSSPFPVITYVAPGGARAASAGTYILYASHVAAMAPATNLGAATPVRIGGSPVPFPTPKDADEEKDKKPAGEKEAEPDAKKKPPKPTLDDKMVNDAVAYIRGLAQLRGRNVEWAEKAVREAASLPAEEALEAGVIDLLASDVDELLTKAQGRTVTLLGREQSLETANARVTAIEPDWRTKLLAVITNPNVAYILLLIGIYGIIFEFYSPGIIFPGVIGAISLLLALFALHVLPINYAGLGLILLGIAFMAAEAFLPAFGALGIGGIIAFVIGSVMLIDTEAPGFGISWVVIGSVAATSAAFFMLVIAMALKARRRPVVSGREGMIGSRGRVIDWAGRAGHVRVRGEVWSASSSAPLEPGREIRVAALVGLTLNVVPENPMGETGNARIH